MSEPIKINDLVVVNKTGSCQCTVGMGKIFTVKEILQGFLECGICKTIVRGGIVATSESGWTCEIKRLTKIDGFDPDVVEQEDLELAI